MTFTAFMIYVFALIVPIIIMRGMRVNYLLALRGSLMVMTYLFSGPIILGTIYLILLVIL